MPDERRNDPFYFLRLSKTRPSDDLYRAAFDLARGLRIPKPSPTVDSPRRGSYAEHDRQFPELVD